MKLNPVSIVKCTVKSWQRECISLHFWYSEWMLSTQEQVYSHIYVYSFQMEWNYEFYQDWISNISKSLKGLL